MARPGLDDPSYAAFALARFRRIMGCMELASLIVTGGGLWLLDRMIGPMPLQMAIATGLGVFFTVLLAALLMGLVFLSAGSGHDETIADPFDDLNQ